MQRPVLRVCGLGAAENDALSWVDAAPDERAVSPADVAHGLIFAAPDDGDLHAVLAEHPARTGVAWIETPVSAAPPAALAVAQAGGIAFDVSTALAYATPLATLFCARLGEVGVLDDPDRRARIELAAHEAASNAVLHGNLGLDDEWRVNSAAFRRRAAAVRDALADPSRAALRVGLAAEWTDAAIDVTVIDQGPGYSRNAIDEAKTRPNRGLSIVVAHADAVAFDDSGRVIRLTFNR